MLEVFGSDNLPTQSKPTGIRLARVARTFILLPQRAARMHTMYRFELDIGLDMDMGKLMDTNKRGDELGQEIW